MSNTSDAARPRTKPGEGVHTKFPVAHRAATRDRQIGFAVSSTSALSLDPRASSSLGDAMKAKELS